MAFLPGETLILKDSSGSCSFNFDKRQRERCYSWMAVLRESSFGALSAYLWVFVPSADYADPMGASALRRFISGGCGGGRLKSMEPWQVKTADQSKKNACNCRPRLQVTNDLLKGVGWVFFRKGVCVVVGWLMGDGEGEDACRARQHLFGSLRWNGMEWKGGVWRESRYQVRYGERQGRFVCRV